MQKDHKEAVVLLDSFEDYGSNIEEEEKRKTTLVKMACPSILVHQKKYFPICFMTLWHVIWKILTIIIDSL
jgi:hypothetical protein